MEFLVFFSFYERSKNLPLPRTLLSHVKQNFKSPASAKGTLSRQNQWGLLCSKKTFPVEILFFLQPNDLHETGKKSLKMQDLCSESLLSNFTATLLCCFFLPSLFLGLHFRAHCHSKTFVAEMFFQTGCLKKQSDSTY